MSGGGASTPSTPTTPTPTPVGEGLYNMQSPDGRPVQIPYSKVPSQGDLGYKFANLAEIQRYAKDHAADPVTESHVDRYIDTLPWWSSPRLSRDLVAGVSNGLNKTVAGLDSAARKVTGTANQPLTSGEEQLQREAAPITRGPVEQAGEAAEGVAEFFTPEEALNLVSKALPFAERLKQATSLAATLEKSPMLAKLVKIGTSVVKNGALTAAQTYAKSGGDADAAERAGLEGGGLTAGLEGFAAPVARAVGRAMTAIPQEVAPGTAEYAEQARAAVESHLNAVNQAIADAQKGDVAGVEQATSGSSPAAAPGAAQGSQASAAAPGTAIEPTEGAQAAPGASSATPAGQIGPGKGLMPRTAVIPSARVEGTPNAPGSRPAAGPQTIEGTRPSQAQAPSQATGAGQRAQLPGTTAAALPNKPAIDVNGVLNTIHDFTGAADRLETVNHAVYDTLDKATDGKFRPLNAAVKSAQDASFARKPGAQELFDSKTAEMEDLLSKTGLNPETLQTFKNSWRQTYQLRNFGNIWDRNINGVPGATKVSQEQQGINGNGLMKGLQAAVRKYKRPQIEAALGPGRLENLETIARANQTVSQRQSFNEGLLNVAKAAAQRAVHIPEAYIGWKLGESTGGGPLAGAAGAAAAVAIRPLTARVLDAIKANPRIGNFFTSAIEMGARPETYGPMIAQMIEQTQQQQDQPNPGDNPQ